MKKILILDPADFIGGAELFAIDVANKMSEEEDLEVHVVTKGIARYMRGLSEKVKVHKRQIERLKVWNPAVLALLFMAIRDLRKILKKNDISTMYTNSIRAHVVGSLASLFTQVRCVWMVHDFTFPRFFAWLLSSIPYKIAHNSMAVKRDLMKKIAKRARKKLVLIPNGFELSKLRKEAENKGLDLRHQFKIGTKPKLIGLVGRVDWWKGQKEFVKAAVELIEKGYDYHFFIIGDANEHDTATKIYKNELEFFVKQRRARERIHFTGHQEGVYAIIKQLDLLVNASTIPEPFGRTILEGMALKVPVLASKLGGPSEIIEDGKDGFLWESPNYHHLGEMIEFILEKEKNIAEIKDSALHKVSEEYSLKKVVSALKQV